MFGGNLVYPPPKVTGIIDMQKSPHAENIYYLITQEGGIFIYTLVDGVGKVLEYYPHDYFVVSRKGEGY